VKVPPVAEMRKALAALAAGVTVAVAGGLLTGQLAVGLTTGIAALTAGLAAFTVRNDPPTVPPGTGV
jgi:hypothetical protein